MNKKVMVGGAIGAVAMFGATAHQPAHAQVYQDLRGQLMGFTGVVNLNTTINALGGLVNSAVLTSITLGPGGSAPGQLIQFNNSGPADDSDLTGVFPLPAIKIATGITLTLPILSLSGSFNLSTGAFAMNASAPSSSTPPIPVSISGLNLTLTATFSNPSASFVGQAGAGLPSDLNITNVGNGPVFINPTVNSNAGVVKLENLSILINPWTLTAVPGPDSLAVFLPGMFGGLALVRRRRRNRA